MIFHRDVCRCRLLIGRSLGCTSLRFDFGAGGVLKSSATTVTLFPEEVFLSFMYLKSDGFAIVLTRAIRSADRVNQQCNRLHRGCSKDIRDVTTETVVDLGRGAHSQPAERLLGRGRSGDTSQGHTAGVVVGQLDVNHNPQQPTGGGLVGSQPAGTCSRWRPTTRCDTSGGTGRSGKRIRSAGSSIVIPQ
jgi:hypothetical protein